MRIALRSFCSCILAAFSLLYSSSQQVSAQNTVSSAPPAQSAASQAAVPGDRSMEIDLYWFERVRHSGARWSRFWDRFAPLYAGLQGDKGLILNVGWTVGLHHGMAGRSGPAHLVAGGEKARQPWVNEDCAAAGLNRRKNTRRMEGCACRAEDGRAARVRSLDLPRSAARWPRTLRNGSAKARHRQLQGGQPGLRLG